jgi:tetratricopeptide (TPR) repeat protein
MGNAQSEIQKAKEAMDEKDFSRARDICVAALKESEGGEADRQVMRDRLDILLTLSDICKHQDRMLDNLNYLDQLIKCARSIDDRELLAKGLIRTGFVFNKLGKRDKAMVYFNEAEELTKDLENRVQYGYVLAGKANIYWRTGENKKAIELAKTVLSIGFENEEYTLTAGAANLLSSAWFELANFTEALRAAMLSVEIYRNAGNLSDLARALNNQGEIFKRMGSFKMAIESYEEGVSVLDGRTVKRFGYLYTNMAECYTRMGDLEEGKISLDKAQVVLENSEDAYAVTCMWFVTGLLEGARGRTEIAREWLEKAEKRMEELGVAYDLGVIRQELVRLLLKAGNKDKARDMSEKAIGVLKKAGAVDLVEEVKELVR